MLDQDTKRQIDSARDILVGKVPDPKAQVEQITTALIYKFMDDMDRENEELGGKAKFLTGKLKQYSWGRLLSKELSGQERLMLYIDALTSFSKAEQIPELFRTIFKDAFLPYRDPETLNLFLKEINGFSYDHSEDLGNAFEYLLSVLGSQGDAGQFRTPRHIIDFIVEVVNPKKSDKILDPACGTAGFLISAYKHIWRQNSSNYKSKDYVAGFASKEAKDVALVEIQGDGQFNGDKLTPDNRKTLGKNVIGYDISPDMVRLSLVNMYLHGFNTPQIFEYDSLTYEERWEDNFDVIFANPPFMTPKGGIRPHKRFQVQANRAEVLFVDYIAEHLTLKGRAGIIVPEGIIFQASNAYKDLRKMLLEENYLWAVVSLPAGVFNPYSGVKTSILFLDRERAKKNDSILFVQLSNDGFDLGAQRRVINKNDLPEAYKILQGWQKGNETKTTLANLVTKQEILDSGDYNLTGDRYREIVDLDNIKWPMVKFGDLCEIGSSKRVFQSEWKKSGVPFYRAREIVKLAKQGFVENELFIAKEMYEDYSQKYGAPQAGDLMVTGVGTLGICYLVKQGDRFYFKDGNIIWFKNFAKSVNSKFIKLLLESDFVKNQIRANAVGGTVGTYTITGAKNTIIPLPPLDVQEEIVAELDGYQRVIDGARQVVKNWKPTIKINPDWEMMRLDKVCDINPESGNPKELFGNNDFVYVDIDSVPNGGGRPSYTKIIKPEKAPSRARRVIKLCDVLISTVRPNLKAFTYISDLPNRVMASTGFAVLRPKDNILLPRFLYYIILDDVMVNQMINKMGRGAYPSINQKDVASLSLRLPPLEEQKIIVKNIEVEQEAVESAKKLIEIHEQKIRTKIAEVWGE